MSTQSSCPDRDVIRDISPQDQMAIRSTEHYFGVGRSALEWIGNSLQAAHKPADDVKQILDLPCGHGRVLRYLKAHFPGATITACDLLRDGVDYCASTFGAIPVYSEDDPKKIRLQPDTFDLIWVGSLLTHLDTGLWSAFLTAFTSWLRPGGLLVFSTHGRYKYDQFTRHNMNVPLLEPYRRAGFGYIPGPGGNPYGVSLSSPAWVFRQLEALDGMRLVLFSERAWDRNHDVFACVRDPQWQVRHPAVTPERRTAGLFTRIARRLLKMTG